MKKLILLVILLVSTNLLVNCQRITNTKSLGQLTGFLSDGKNGSGFTIIIFEVKNKMYTNFKITSTNTKSKNLLDSLILINQDYFKMEDERNGSYALPIIQIMYDDAKGELLWNNNTYWSMASYGKNFHLSSNTILLKPLIISSGPPIIN